MSRVLSIIPFEAAPGRGYLYDDNTGMVFPSNSATLDLLEAHRDVPLEAAVASLSGRHPADALETAADFINRWETRFGAFYRSPEYGEAARKQMLEFSQHDVESLLSEHAWIQLVLVLTENCNLRCSYCYYSEAYPLSRNRTDKQLSFETGRKALDYFFAQAAPKIASNPMRKLAINFYGGEPLMAQKVLRELTLYAKEHAPAEVVFALTTNGTMLRGEVVDFLVEQGFYILVSLDGGAEDHDRNRIFPGGGGTFERIKQNVIALRDRHPDYKKVHHISVFDWKTDLTRVNQFHEDNADWLPPLQMTSQANENDTSYYKQFSEEDKNRFKETHQRLERLYLDARTSGQTVPVFARVYFEMRIVGALLRRRQGNLPFGILPFTNTCVPGSKLAVRTDGTLDICERINGTMPIGDVDHGVDFALVEKIIKDYNEKICGDCWSCPATKLCSRCFASCNTEGTFSNEESCADTVEGIRLTLSTMYRILETQPDAFSDLSFFNPELQMITR